MSTIYSITSITCKLVVELSASLVVVELFIIWKLKNDNNNNLSKKKRKKKEDNNNNNNNNNRKEIPRLFYLKKKRENFRGKKLKAQKERKS